MKRGLYRAHGDSTCRNIDRRHNRNQAHQLLQQYMNGCDSIFHSRFIDVSESDRCYVNQISAILQNKPLANPDSRVKRRSRVLQPIQPTESLRVPTRVQHLPVIDQSCRINVRAVAKSITYIHRSILDKRAKTIRNRELKIASPSPKQSPQIFIRQSPMRIETEPQKHSKRESLIMTVRRGWAIDEDQQNPSIDEFLRQ